MPTRRELEKAVVLLNQRYPHCRIAWGWDEARRRWTIPRSSVAIPAIVVDGDHGSLDDLGQTLDNIAGDRSLPSPLALVRGENYLGLRMSHAVGDGRTFNQVLAAVLHTAFSGEAYPWQLGPTHRFPLTQTILKTFGSEPRLLRAILADRPSRVALSPGKQTAWVPARRTLAVTITAEDKATILASTPGASWQSLLISILLPALNAEGIAVAPDISVIVDVRRYLSSQSLDGNFVTGVPFNIDHRDGPHAIAATLKATLTSGRPVATQAAATMHSGRSDAGRPTTTETALPVRVTFSAMGPPPEYASLPFLTGGPQVYAGGVEPDGPHGLTFLVLETTRNCMVTASFHQNVVSADAVRAALGALTCRRDGRLSHDAVKP
ncbi:hypothetical protein [Mycolicibacterium hodleri]|uniref:Uncharacterized protein n=1 Tax=Mycolicibacterium hodleri TaxID=49897 RepID=A0A502E4S9_9MYCO|nr:hypothetical protein [Mycolicibacterium hodleri]TPG31440.1 hypothetical protein EAH80_23355 [Mycolicibacterium hodleri]